MKYLHKKTTSPAVRATKQGGSPSWFRKQCVAVHSKGMDLMTLSIAIVNHKPICVKVLREK
jgi:hypothetical protein